MARRCGFSYFISADTTSAMPWRHAQAFWHRCWSAVKPITSMAWVAAAASANIMDMNNTSGQRSGNVEELFSACDIDLVISRATSEVIVLFAVDNTGHFESQHDIIKINNLLLVIVYRTFGTIQKHHFLISHWHRSLDFWLCSKPYSSPGENRIELDTLLILDKYIYIYICVCVCVCVCIYQCLLMLEICVKLTRQ